MTKKIFDRLIAVEWIDNLETFESPEQKGVTECRPKWRKGEGGQADGALKMVAFSKLYRELLKAGPITMEEINLIVDYGKGMAILGGSEKI